MTHLISGKERVRCKVSWDDVEFCSIVVRDVTCPECLARTPGREKAEAAVR